MTLVVLLAACFGLAIVVALRLRALRSREANDVDIGNKADVATAWTANDTRRFPHFG